MTEKQKATPAGWPICHFPSIATALGSLFVGGAEYLFSRTPDSSHIGHLMGDWFGDLSGPIYLFGPLGPYLPDFIHPFAFILLTVAPFPNAGMSLKGFVSLGWLAFSLLFEIGQRYGASISGWIAALVPDGWFATALENYFSYGTFSPGDLIAIILGVLAGYIYVCAFGPGKRFRD